MAAVDPLGLKDHASAVKMPVDPVIPDDIAAQPKYAGEQSLLSILRYLCGLYGKRRFMFDALLTALFCGQSLAARE